MPANKAASIYALQLRVAALAADGSTPAGPAGLIVTDALVRIEASGVYDEPDEIVRKNGAGVPCVVYQPPPSLKRVDIGAIEVCNDDPDLEVLLAGGSVLTDGGATVGAAWPAVGSNPTPYGVSIEAWSYAIEGGAPAADLPYFHWVMPRVYLRRNTITLEEGVRAPGFTGYGIENPAWGNGPQNDWEFESERVFQYVRTATMPALTDGIVAIPTQTP